MNLELMIGNVPYEVSTEIYQDIIGQDYLTIIVRFDDTENNYIEAMMYEFGGDIQILSHSGMFQDTNATEDIVRSAMGMYNENAPPEPEYDSGYESDTGEIPEDW